MTNFLEPRTKAEQTDVLAQYLRDDRLHLAKNIEGSNLRKVLTGLACQWLRFRDKVNEVSNEYDINQTTALIEEWERVVGIPDDCFSNTGSLEDRRRNILVKLAGVNVSTAKQFEDLAQTFGFDVTVSNGVDEAVLPATLPLILLDPDEAPFTIIVTLNQSLQPTGLPLELPFELTDQAPEILECLFDKLKPANTQIIFRYS